VLAPISLATFFAEIYEREPLHAPREGKHSFDDVFSMSELENVLIVGAREPERFALVRADGDELSLEAFTVLVPPPRPRAATRAAIRVLDARAIAARVKAGYTLVVKDASGFSPSLSRFCAALGADFGCYVQANVYLTPPGGQGLRAHHDTHDTLTLQIDGEKEWTVYDPMVELPLETQVLAGGLPASAIMHARVHLRAGDSLYLPRGFPHEARGTRSRSLHVTFALVPVRAIDVLESLVRVVAASDVELRRAILPDEPAGEILARFISQCTPEHVERARDLAIAEMRSLQRTAESVFEGL
jgi:hypothetical protein